MPRRKKGGRSVASLVLGVVAVAAVAMLVLPGWPSSYRFPASPGPAAGAPSGVGRDTARDHVPSSPPTLTWTELLPEGTPPNNLTTTPVLVSDPLTSQVLEFDGSTLSDGLTSIWSYSTGGWTNVTPSGSLTRQDLTEYTATFDASAGVVLLFGYVAFQDSNPAVGETWTLSGGTWSELAPTAEPHGTVMAGLTYDPISSSSILLTAVYGDPTALSWSFANGSWSQLATSAAPPALYGSAMAFDNSTVDPELVLYTDGIQPAGPVRGFWNQTWVYRSAEWTNVTSTVGPGPARGSGPMTYDASDQAVLLAAEAFFTNGSPATTWEFIDGRWSYLPTPSWAPFVGTGWQNFVYDPSTGSSLLVTSGVSAYTGLTTSETWLLSRTAIGPPPVPALTVTPRNPSQGGWVSITASASGGYGSLGVLLRVSLPGCSLLAYGREELSCTTAGSGEGTVVLSVTDQAGRRVSTYDFVNVSASSPSGRGWLDYVVGGAVGAAAVAAAVVLTRWSHRRPPPAAHAPTSGPGVGAPPP